MRKLYKATLLLFLVASSILILRAAESKPAASKSENAPTQKKITIYYRSGAAQVIYFTSGALENLDNDFVTSNVNAVTKRGYPYQAAGGRNAQLTVEMNQIMSVLVE